MRVKDIFINDNGSIRREGIRIEYKESFSLNGRSKYLKTIFGYANSRGGHIIFGIADRPRKVVGINQKKWEKEIEEFIKYVNSYLNDQVQVNVELCKYSNKYIGVIYTPEAFNKPIICPKNDGDLKEGAIYYKYNSEVTNIKKTELENIILNIREQERMKWEKILKNIISGGIDNITTLNKFSGEIDGSGNFIVDDKLLEQIKTKIKFIEEGSFNEKSGDPALKLIGNIVPENIIMTKKGAFDNDTYCYRATDIQNQTRISKSHIFNILCEMGLRDNDDYYSEVVYSGKNKIRKYTKKALEVIQDYSKHNIKN